MSTTEQRIRHSELRANLLTITGWASVILSIIAIFTGQGYASWFIIALSVALVVMITVLVLDARHPYPCCCQGLEEGEPCRGDAED